MYYIESEYIKAAINAKGAELQSFFDKVAQQEYMWNGNPEFWGKKSPVLFPIVGALKDNTYFFNDKSYMLGRHGFARDMSFEVENQSATAITFILKSNEATIKVFPFQFEFRIGYAIENKKLSVSYIVKNVGNSDMYFSVGGHPAFKVPIFERDDYTDYLLKFNKTENAGRWLATKEGLISQEPVPFLTNEDSIPLSKDLFKQEAIVFKQLVSNSINIVSKKTGKGLSFDFTGFPYLGIWAAHEADFVCIEPWCGIADSVDTSQQFCDKEGINRLISGTTFLRTWSIEVKED